MRRLHTMPVAGVDLEVFFENPLALLGLLLGLGVVAGVIALLLKDPLRKKGIRELADKLKLTYHAEAEAPAEARQSLSMLHTAGGTRPIASNLIEGEYHGKQVRVFDFGQRSISDSDGAPSNLGTVALIEYNDPLPTCNPTNVEGHDPRMDVSFGIQFESQGRWLAIRPLSPYSPKPRRASAKEVKAMIHMLPGIARDLARTNLPHNTRQ